MLLKKKTYKKTIWKTILNKKKLGPNRNHNFKINNHSTFNFIKLNIFPDGGVARIRLNGIVDLEKINLKWKKCKFKLHSKWIYNSWL